MPKEALSSNRSDQGLPQGGVELSFDELARAMAEGSLSRRRALKLIAGTALAALIPSRALADEDCVRICHVPFDRETKECDFAKAETRCVSRRERRRHLENHPCDCRGRCANCLAPPCISNGNGPCADPSECCSGNCDISGFCLPPTGTNRVDCFCSNGTQDSRCTSLSCSSSDADAIRSFVCNPLCAINGASTDSVGCVADAACA
jgi:hypothetical protein